MAFAIICSCANHKDLVREEPYPSGELNYQAFDSATAKPVVDTLAMVHKQDSLPIQTRQQGMAEWSERVRAAVEPYWILPRELVKYPYESVALIRIGRNGDLQNVTWVSKSMSSAFNAFAAKAIHKVKRFPAFPPEIPEETLEIRYKFMTPGKAFKRKKLIMIQQNPHPGCCLNCDTICVPSKSDSARGQ